MTSLQSQAEAETAAALEGIVDALGGLALPAGLALVPLRVYGDALRLGLEAPRALRRWAGDCSPALLDDVLRATLAWIDARNAPVPSKDATFEPALATTLRERDHAESLLHAVRRAWLPRPLAQLAAYGPLVARLREVDEGLAESLTRADVTTLLGVRAALGAQWAHAFTEDVAPSEDDDRLLSSLRGSPPSPELVARYIESGAMHATVEGTAAADPDFAAELAETIDAMRGCGQAGLFARRWLKSHAKDRAAEGAFTFHAPRLAYAAASESDEATAIEHRLGALFADLDVDATFFVSEREVALEVDFDAGVLASIQLGKESRAPAQGETSCRIVLPRSTTGRVVLSVRATTGQSISEEIVFAFGTW